MTITNESTMAAVDAALDPAFKALDANAGSLHVSVLKHALSCVRQALAHAVYGAEPAPEVVEHDVATEQQKAADAERAEAEQDAADKPDAETTDKLFT